MTAIATARGAAPSPTATAAGDFIYLALDRGPEGTPYQDRLRVYVFAALNTLGTVKLLAPDGAVVGTRAGIMGSGIFTADSCVPRVSSKANGLITIGALHMTDAAQAAFLASPAAYRAEVDRSVITPGARSIVVQLVDSGCRPR